MNPARELIFPGATFAGDQQCGGSVGKLFGEFEHVERGRIDSYPRNDRRIHCCAAPLSGSPLDSEG